MKQLLLLLAAVLLSFPCLDAQNTDLQNFVERYKKDPAFTFAFVSKDLLETATAQKIEEKDWKKLQQVVRNIGSLTILAADDLKTAPDLYREAQRQVPEDLDELLSVRDNDDRVRIWVKEDQSAITDMVLLAGTSNDFALVFFSGLLELNNIGELAQLLDAQQAEDLARTAQAISVEFQISPNPSAGQITLQYTNTSDDPAQLSISDQSGRLLHTLLLQAEQSQTLRLPDLPNGLYWVQMKTAGGKVGVKQLQIHRG